MRVLAPALLIFIAAVAARAYEAPPPVNDEVILSEGLPGKLSDFGFFTDQAGRQPNLRVVPYNLNSALFSDYSEKYRFIYVPAGKKLGIDPSNPDGLLKFPSGSTIIKSFGYEQNGEMRLLETRVLLHREKGWLALPYLWNEGQTEATLKVSGKRLPIIFTDPMGQEQTISYAVPNKNQCKECHSLSDTVMPIGPKLRNIEMASIDRLAAAKLLPSDAMADDIMPDYSNKKIMLKYRARAYLDINCAHCHNRQGSASNSGLFLTYQEPDNVHIGIGKRPTAAGRGSGGREFAIAPGQPDKSYTIYRMKSLDPGIAMPEIGRSTVHIEGVELLSEWIAEMGK